jgi:hypothetical protein
MDHPFLLPREDQQLEDNLQRKLTRTLERETLLRSRDAWFSRKKCPESDHRMNHRIENGVLVKC